MGHAEGAATPWLRVQERDLGRGDEDGAETQHHYQDQHALHGILHSIQ
jgi:hypothetical protein